VNGVKEIDVRRHPRVPGHGRALRCRHGFTLLELTVAVSILAVLGSIAQASFHSYAMRARRTEAKSGLASIHRAQSAHYAESLAYADTFDEIGDPFEGGSRVDVRTIKAPTYTFTVRALPLDGHLQGNFQAMATGDLDPGDQVLDVLMIENQLTVLP
jgi:prepilin-type N-terminal cleavage/methylation domain-containing protein